MKVKYVALCGGFAAGCLKCRVPVIFGFLAVTLLQAKVCGQALGIAIHKESSSHPDGGAKVFEYASISRSAVVTQYLTPQGQKVALTKFQPQVVVAYPNHIYLTLTGPDQLGSIKTGLQSFRGTVAKYPNAGRFLNRHIEAADEIVRRVNGSEVLFNGAWMSRPEYEALVRREDDEANKFREKSREKKRKAEEEARRLDLETRRHKR